MKAFYFIDPNTRKRVVCKVDDEDAYRLRSEVWYLTRRKSGFYLRRSINGQEFQFSHAIMNDNAERVVYIHKNGDSTDYRKNNLLRMSMEEFNKFLEISAKIGKITKKLSGFCVHGHNLDKVGFSRGGKCKECVRETQRKSYQKIISERKRMQSVFDSVSA